MIVYGKNTVMQLIEDNRKIFKITLLENSSFKEIEAYAAKKKIAVQYAKRRDMDKMAEGGNHQGVIVEAQDYKIYDLDGLLKTIHHDLPLLVMLDGLEDPHNLGAILRTCDAIGADGIIIPKHRTVTLTPTVAKVSTGAIDTIPVAQVTNLTQTLKTLKEKGYWVTCADMKNAQDYRSSNYDTPLVLVIGSEGFGVSRLVRSECDYAVSLPMIGKVSSLNASVACSILLYEIYSKRHPLGGK